MDLDDDCWWLWCGTECGGAFIGPHPSLEAAEDDRNGSNCGHDHAVFRMTPRQMVAKMPASAYVHTHGFHDYRTGGPLICAPLNPRSSSGFAVECIRMMGTQLKGAAR